MSLRRGVRLAVDVGSVRVGVARSDPEGLLAVPVATLAAATAVADLRNLVAELDVFEVYVGNPIGLDGRPGRAAAAAAAFAAELAGGLAGVPVRLVDERLSTVSAGRGLQAAGRTQKEGRAVIDQAAAVVILEHALAHEAARGEAPGTLVQEVR